MARFISAIALFKSPLFEKMLNQRRAAQGLPPWQPSRRGRSINLQESAGLPARRRVPRQDSRMAGFLRGECTIEVADLIEAADEDRGSAPDVVRVGGDKLPGDMMGNIKQILADDTITDEKKIFLIAKLLADRDEDLDDEDLDEVESDRLPKTELQKKLGEARVMARRMRDSGQLLEDLRGGTGSGAHSGSGSGFTMY